MTGETRRAAGLGVLGHVVIATLLVTGTVLAGVFGGEGGAMAAALSFLPALALLGIAYLLVVVVVAAVPALRRRVGSGRGLLLGWVIGCAAITAILWLLLSLA